MNKRSAVGSLSVFILGFALLIVAGALVRIPYLTHYPPQVHNDESATGSYILELLKSGGWALYGTTWGHPNLNFWISSIPTKLTCETSVWTIRLMAAI
jgi:predicted membrane-bound mannosyltransferase